MSYFFMHLVEGGNSVHNVVQLGPAFLFSSLALVYRNRWMYFSTQFSLFVSKRDKKVHAASHTWQVTLSATSCTPGHHHSLKEKFKGKYCGKHATVELQNLPYRSLTWSDVLKCFQCHNMLNIPDNWLCCS